MKFGEIEDVEGIAFYFSLLDGILGLAYDTISMHHLPTFIDSSNLEDKSFAFYLHLNPEKSYMTLPGYDKTAMTGDFQFHDVIEKKYWSLQLTSMSVGNTKVDTSGYKAIIDSGTSVLVGPDHIVNPLIEGIEVAMDCINLEELPDIKIVFDSTEYVLTSKDYVLEVDDPESGQRACMLAIMSQPFPEGFNYFIFGDSFMRKYYTYFDKNNDRVGFVLAANL